ncbi:MAG: hypothetical protein HY329_02790 [Chloroflexi bacterium]|nr:hypothetical protein [Chloroflexota bacterium]
MAVAPGQLAARTRAAGNLAMAELLADPHGRVRREQLLEARPNPTTQLHLVKRRIDGSVDGAGAVI